MQSFTFLFILQVWIIFIEDSQLSVVMFQIWNFPFIYSDTQLGLDLTKGKHQSKIQITNVTIILIERKYIYKQGIKANRSQILKRRKEKHQKINKSSMITQAELIEFVGTNMHLFQQQFQTKQNLIVSRQQSHKHQSEYKMQQKMTPQRLKQQPSAKRINRLFESHHQSVNENHNSDVPQKLRQQIPHKRRHKIFSMPSHTPKQNTSQNEQIQTIRPSPKTNTFSLQKSYKQNQCFNANIERVIINPPLKTHINTVNKKLQLFSNDYLPSPSQLNAILKSISRQSQFVPDESIQSRKSLRNKRQLASIRYHEVINYEPQIEMTKKIVHPERNQISKIKFNYVDSKYYLER